MQMETVTLSRIVKKYIPELYPTLTPKELNTKIVLRDGEHQLDAEDVIEIVQRSICEHQKYSLIQ
ncbi:hypothetical protein PRECH8_11210 [Insulibacter thermoxylanivorax]|uniref:Uncharacterized protein n=1 Tax=Insulibacter thermoxylanivorax TaxID=2749268 RepID=A0A916QBR6_9BACL|nr:hypothetical protein [Insulibacter thermoxylanivorax]GFR37825.1 hypothetical protein PRECH8_11210 [Insulibacter thermoxylanivorax]